MTFKSIYIQINHIYSIYSFTSTNMQSLSTTFELKWCINKKTPIFSQSQKHHIPLILNHEMCYKSDERWEEQDPNIQRCWIEMRESRAFTNLWSKWARTSSTRAKNSKNNWAEWLGRGRGKGDKGVRDFGPSWWFQPGPKAILLPWLVDPTGTNGPRGLWSRLEPQTRTKGPCTPHVPS